MDLIRSILWDLSCTKGRLGNYAIQLLIILSILSFSATTLPNLPPNVSTILHNFEVFVILLFTLEYILRLFTARNTLKYMFSFFGIIDLLAIIPFYISAAVGLQSLRAIRLLGLLRILKLARYNRSLNFLISAFKIAKNELIIMVFMAVIMIYLAAVGIYFFENKVQPDAFQSIFHSLWWSVITLTTVGYGDVYPITIGGKIFTFIMLMVGLSMVALPAGVFANALEEAREQEKEEESHRVSLKRKSGINENS